MPNWQALPYKLKLQIFGDLISSVIRAGPQWSFAPEAHFTIVYGIRNFLDVAPELRNHTLELLEKLLIVDTSDFGLGKMYRLLLIAAPGLHGPEWCWSSSKERVERAKQDILREVKEEMKEKARCLELLDMFRE